jgi:hypothetical protein
MLVGVDFLKRFGEFEIDIVEAHLPLLNPGPDLNAVVAVLPPLGFRIELLLSRFRDLVGEGAGLLHCLVVVKLCLDDRPRKRRDLPIECGDGAIERGRPDAKIGRQHIAPG